MGVQLTYSTRVTGVRWGFKVGTIGLRWSLARVANRWMEAPYTRYVSRHSPRFMNASHVCWKQWITTVAAISKSALGLDLTAHPQITRAPTVRHCTQDANVEAGVGKTI